MVTKTQWLSCTAVPQHSPSAAPAGVIGYSLTRKFDHTLQESQHQSPSDQPLLPLRRERRPPRG